jgi:hypothetical protein
VSDDRSSAGSSPSNPVAVSEAPASAPALSTAAPTPSEKLDSVEEIDFLLEEIESKIAPLALA